MSWATHPGRRKEGVIFLSMLTEWIAASLQRIKEMKQFCKYIELGPCYARDPQSAMSSKQVKPHVCNPRTMSKLERLILAFIGIQRLGEGSGLNYLGRVCGVRKKKRANNLLEVRQLQLGKSKPKKKMQEARLAVVRSHCSFPFAWLSHFRAIRSWQKWCFPPLYSRCQVGMTVLRGPSVYAPDHRKPSGEVGEGWRVMCVPRYRQSERALRRGLDHGRCGSQSGPTFKT